MNLLTTYRIAKLIRRRELGLTAKEYDALRYRQWSHKLVANGMILFGAVAVVYSLFNYPG